MYWFTKEWWKYLLSEKDEEISWVTVVFCSPTEHRCGVIFYNSGGLEPNMRCKRCGDDLG